MQVSARGILFHHFWGVYKATIYLTFATALEARLALETGRLAGFAIGKPKPGADPQQAARVLWWFGGDPELPRVLDALVLLGAEKSAINSVAHSIDHGDPFTIELDVADPRQGALFEEENR